MSNTAEMPKMTANEVVEKLMAMHASAYGPEAQTFMRQLYAESALVVVMMAIPEADTLVRALLSREIEINAK
jgi:hypothetical protein